VANIVEEASLPGLLELFYSRVRADDRIGPLFNDVVDDWSSHRDRLCDFWSSVMLTSGKYKGNPMAVHLRQAARLDPPMFERWLLLWKTTTDEILPPAAASAMQAKAGRISESLQRALKLHIPEGKI
jgi:hemoglobin